MLVCLPIGLATLGVAVSLFPYNGRELAGGRIDSTTETVLYGQLSLLFPYVGWFGLFPLFTDMGWDGMRSTIPILGNRARVCVPKEALARTYLHRKPYVI